MDLRVGDLVWSKMKGFPAWPSKVMEKPGKGRRHQHKVLFFGTGDHAWIQDDLIQLHSDGVLLSARASPKKPSPSFLKAMREMEEAATTHVRPPTPPLKAGPSVAAQLADKYRRLKEAKKLAHLPRRRGPFTVRNKAAAKKQKPRAVITPYDEEPHKKKIGFLGLGGIGQRLVLCLLKAGHRVTVWNRSSETGDNLVKAGARRGSSPAQVVAACDWTLCCMSDPAASRTVVFQSGGVLKGLEGTQGKGYIELTSLDPLTSQEIGEAVNFLGGRYLEAPMQGTCQQGERGEMVLHCAGDFELFHQLEEVFHAISRHAYFIDHKVGSGASLSLLQSSVVGCVQAGLGEALALGDRAGISRHSLLEVLRLMGLNAPMFRDKADGESESGPAMPLRNQQLQLELATQLAHAKMQPVPVMAAANELHKHAKRMGYGRKDVASLYTSIKF